MFADRTSAASMKANQLRLWFASMAYVLLAALRRIGLAHTELERATCGTLRVKLLKIGAKVRVTVRRIRVAMASAKSLRRGVRPGPRPIMPLIRANRAPEPIPSTTPDPCRPEQRRSGDHGWHACATPACQTLREQPCADRHRDRGEKCGLAPPRSVMLALRSHVIRRNGTDHGQPSLRRSRAKSRFLADTAIDPVTRANFHASPSSAFDADGWPGCLA